MSMRLSKGFAAVLAVAALSVALTRAQAPASAEWLDPETAIRIRASDQIPLTVLSTDFSDTEIYVRGPFIVIDLRCLLLLRNDARQRLEGVTFAVEAQRLAAGGKASVALPSLRTAAGETFPARLNLRLLRPLPGPVSPLVEISVDGVLMGDLSFFGPDKLDSRRKMTLLALEALRDRDYFKTVLGAEGREGLRRSIQNSLERQARRPRLEARLAGGSGRALSTAAAAAPEARVELAFLDLPAAPIELLSGSARAAGSAAVSPRITLRNRSPKAIRRLEISWIVRDAEGRSYSAGAAPTGDFSVLAAGARATVGAERRYAFRDPKSGAEFSIGGMSGYVRRVEFADGSYWIPSRDELERASLFDIEPVSVEERRLGDLYRKKGLDALVDELSR